MQWTANALKHPCSVWDTEFWAKAYPRNRIWRYRNGRKSHKRESPNQKNVLKLQCWNFRIIRKKAEHYRLVHWSKGEWWEIICISKMGWAKSKKSVNKMGWSLAHWSSLSRVPCYCFWRCRVWSLVLTNSHSTHSSKAIWTSQFGGRLSSTVIFKGLLCDFSRYLALLDIQKEIKRINKDKNKSQ